MRILILDNQPVRRGAQVFAAELANALKQKTIFVKRVYLYAYESAGKIEIDEYDEILGANSQHFTEKWLSVNPILLYRLVNSIKRFQPHIVLISGGRAVKYAAAAKIFSWEVTNVYRIIDIPGFWNRQILKQWYYRLLIMPFISGGIGVSEASVSNMRSLYNFRKPLAYIPNAYNPALLQQTRSNSRAVLGINPQTPILLFLGNLTRQKRPDRFIQIAKSIQTNIPNLQLWFVGDGVLKNECVALAQQLQLKQVQFWGYQSIVSLYIAAADVLLMPSDTEGMPAAVLEAAHLQVPAVCSNVGGLTDCVIDGETGFLVAPDDVETFVQKTSLLLNDAQLRESMGEKAKTKVANFTIDAIADQYLEFFNALLVKNEYWQMVHAD